MIHVNTKRGGGALTIVQSAALIEMGGLPLWVGVLMGHHGFDPRQAGALISLYVAGAIISCFIIAPIFARLNSGRLIAVCGMVSGAIIFYLISTAGGYSQMSLLHFVGGLSIGPVLSVSQGTIGRSRNPHRLFAITTVAASLMAAMFLGVMPTMVSKFGGVLFFQVIAIIFAIAALTALIAFPSAEPGSASELANAERKKGGQATQIPGKVWFGFAGLMCMAIVFSMSMSFVERVGMHRQYGLAAVSGVLTIMAFAKLLPGAIAGVLQNRLSVRRALILAPVVLAISSAAVYAVPNLLVYSIGAPIFIMPLTFAQVFVFGLISKLEPTGKATALCPSVLMIGTMIGPIVGGSIVKAAGYPSLAIVSVLGTAGALACFYIVTVDEKTSSRRS